MKIRTLIVCILGIWLVSNISIAQDVKTLEPVSSFETPAEPKPEKLYRGQPIQNAKSTPSPTYMKIYQLRYADAENVARLISNLFRINTNIDLRLNRLIVIATQEQMESVENLIQAMDVADPEASTSQDGQNLLYSIYMFETSSGDESMKSFSMILRTTTHVSSQELLDTAANKDLQISEFLQSNDFNEPEVEILIQGKTTSNESLKRMVSGLAPKSNIIELKWDDDETFTNNVAAAQYTQLPEQMQKHIHKFLGDNIKTVGYWFGNLSVPGEIEAPIGSWMLRLELESESDRELELRVDVEVPERNYNFERRLGRERSNEILSNTVRAKVGKPIIIGYNRESYGTRKMGAMVIIPEVDVIPEVNMTQLKESKK